MTQEEKQVLLKDLCARLPYEIILLSPNEKITYQTDGNTAAELLVEEGWKPYLRPMSSMTEEEKEELAFIRDRDFQSVRKWINDESIKETRNICPITYGEVDFCNKKHLDYRGLIEKGLAIKVTEENNPYKE